MNILNLASHFAIAIVLSGAASAHEFWIQPLDYTVDSSDRVTADFRNGQDFKGASQPFIPRNYTKTAIVQGGKTSKMPVDIGARPALNKSGLADGLTVLIVETKPQSLNYPTYEKFQKFVSHKDLGVTKADHLAMGHPETNFTESYLRFAKSLVGVGHAKGKDKRFGAEIELVALANPYTDSTSAGLPVQAFYQGKPRANAQIELFDKSPNGSVRVSTRRTNSNGIAVIPVKAGHSYLLDTVVLRKAGKGAVANAVWETVWASLTFAKE